MCVKVQLIYALESDSATLGRAYTAINDMSTQVAAALDNPAPEPLCYRGFGMLSDPLFASSAFIATSQRLL